MPVTSADVQRMRRFTPDEVADLEVDETIAVVGSDAIMTLEYLADELDNEPDLHKDIEFGILTKTSESTVVIMYDSGKTERYALDVDDNDDGDHHYWESEASFARLTLHSVPRSRVRPRRTRFPSSAGAPRAGKSRLRRSINPRTLVSRAPSRAPTIHRARRRARAAR